ncbi:hypothetical protein EVAR_40849_1 [Eumeta japonica]|uniref:Uncharacterized protein n=1 Tax=Eumeta variegata TaxID=151549 RepID=A0A4C1ZWB2_EUMVA|nr:hypothetical protein EVAR_40849_1 [Eumeta japonica]
MRFETPRKRFLFVYVAHASSCCFAAPLHRKARRKAHCYDIRLITVESLVRVNEVASFWLRVRTASGVRRTRR